VFFNLVQKFTLIFIYASKKWFKPSFYYKQVLFIKVLEEYTRIVEVFEA